jgi:hypothetical protein
VRTRQDDHAGAGVNSSALLDLQEVSPAFLIRTLVARSGTLEFANVRALAWWLMREALDPASGRDVALPPDPELLADLTAPRWAYGLNGIRVESKEDVVARLGRSPDCGDAVVLSNYQGAGTAGASPPRFLGGGAPLPSADRPQMPPLPGRVDAVMPPQGSPATRPGSTNRSTGGTPLPRLPPMPRRGPVG